MAEAQTMTFDEAIDFFANYGNISRETSRLYGEKPTIHQLRAAFDAAIRAGQPEDIAWQAMNTLIAAGYVHIKVTAL